MSDGLENASEDTLFARYGRRFPAGAVLFRQGDPGDSMFVIRSGTVRVLREATGAGADDERHRTLAVLGAGEFLGEMAILTGRPRSATAQAVEDADALVLSAKTFEQMVQSHSEIAVRLITKLARRLDAADTLVEILLHRDPRARVVLALRREAELRGRVQDDGSVLLPLGTDELAEQVGLAPDEVNEVLLRLARHELVAQDLPGLVVPDPLRLHEFSQSLEPRG